MSDSPKRHHYLPRFYLEGFTRNRLLWLYDRERKQFRPGTPEKTAVIKHYYVLEMEDGGKDFSIERYFSVVEGKAKTVIDKIQRRTIITPAERADLALFIALLITRTPRFERDVQAMADAAAKHLIKRGVPNVETVENLLRRSGTKLDPQDMLKFIQDEQFTLKMSRNFILSAMVEKAHKFGLDVCLMNWKIVHAPERTSFITTDQPVGFFVPPASRRIHEPVLGLASEKITKLIPLTQRTAVVIGNFGGQLTHQDFTQQEVRDVNIAVATECEGYVIGRDEELVRSVVTASKVDVSNPGTRMRVDHVPHPTHPNRTFLVTRRVAADAPNEPPQIIIKNE
jgi:hypothetical protein